MSAANPNTTSPISPSYIHLQAVDLGFRWGSLHSPQPTALIAVLQKACALDPAGRYSSAADFAQALPEDRKPSTVRKKTAPKATRHIQKPWDLYATAALVAGLLVYLALMLI